MHFSIFYTRAFDITYTTKTITLIIRLSLKRLMFTVD